MTQLQKPLRPVPTYQRTRTPDRYASQDDVAPGMQIDLPQLLRVLRRKWWMVLSVGVLAGGLAVYWSRGVVQLYQGSALVQLSPTRGALTDGMAGVRSGGTPVEQLSLSGLEILRSNTVMAAVVDSEPIGLRVQAEGFPLSLLSEVVIDPTYPSKRIPLRFTPGGVVAGRDTLPLPYGVPIRVDGIGLVVERAPTADELVQFKHESGPGIAITSREFAMAQLARDVRGRPRDREKSSLIDILYTSPDPVVATRVVNRTAQTFQDDVDRRAQEQSRRRRMFIGEQLGRVDSQANAAELELSVFRAQQQAYSSAEKFAGEQKDLQELTLRERRLVSSRALVQDILDRSEQSSFEMRTRASRMLASAPDFAGNMVLLKLIDRLVAYEASRSELVDGQRYTAREPQVIKYDSLISSTHASITVALQSHLALLDAELGDLRTQRGARERALATLPGVSAQEARLSANAFTLREQGSQLRLEYQRARISEAAALGPVEIVNLATAASPLGSIAPRVVVFATLFGLAVGMALITVPVMRDRALRRRRDVEEQLQVPVVAMIPRMEPIENRRLDAARALLRRRHSDAPPRRERTMMLTTPDAWAHPSAEAYRHLRATLFSSHVAEAPRKLLVTSACPSEGKTSVAVNLASTLARQGRRVLLIDGDLRKGRLHRVFGIPVEPGLTDALRGTETPLGVVRWHAESNLNVIPVGTGDPAASDLLPGPRLRAMLNDLAHEFDVVIVDAPPVLALSDPLVFGASMDAALLVVRAGQTTSDEVTTAAQQLTQSGTPLVGVVLNDPDGEVQGEISSAYYDSYAAV